MSGRRYGGSRNDFGGSRRSGGGGGGGGGGGVSGRFKIDRRSGASSGRDYEDRRGGGGRWMDGGGEMYGGGGGYMGGGGGGYMDQRQPTVLPPGSKDYWEFRDSEDELAAKPAEESFEVDAKRQKLEIDDGLLPGIEIEKSDTAATDGDQKKETPKSLLDINMDDVVDNYYEYFDGGPNISQKRARQFFGGMQSDDFMDGTLMGMPGMHGNQRMYKVVAGEYKFFDGPGPKSTELIKVGQDGRRVSPEEKLFLFVQFILKASFADKSPATVMDNCRGLMNPRQAIKLIYKITPEEEDSEGPFQCTFYAAGFKIVEVEASTKDEVKYLAAEKGLYTLMTKTFNEICPNNYFADYDDGNYETKIKHRDDEGDKGRKDKGEKEKDKEEKEEKDGETEKEEKDEDKKDDADKEEDMEIKEEKDDTEKDNAEKEKDKKDEKTKGRESNDRRSLDRFKESRRRKGPTWRSPKLIIRLQVMKKVLTGTHVSNAFSDMEAAAFTCQVALCIVCYKKTKLSRGSDPMRCDMYADELLLGSGGGINFGEAHTEVYRVARDNFLRTSVHSLLMNSKRLSDIDRADPDILDIVYRGHYQEIGSNNGSLKTYDIYPSDPSKTVDDLVMFEFDDGPSKATFYNLKNSATKSHMLFEWVLSSKDDKSTCRCLVYLQGDLIADVQSTSKVNAKKLATHQINKQYRSTHTIIRCTPVDYTIPTITYKDLKQLAVTESGEEDPSNEVLKPLMQKNLENIISQKIQEGSLEPVVFNEDISGDLRKAVKKFAETNNYPLLEKPSDTKKHLILQRKMFTAADMMKVLEVNDHVSGKYKLVQKRQGDEVIRYFDTDGETKLDPPTVTNVEDIASKTEETTESAETKMAE